MTVQTTASVRASGPVRMWYRDPISCLQSTLATVLLHAGADPLPVLGLAWEFRYVPGDVRSEEFYYPGRYDGDLAHSLAPYHAISSTWWRPRVDDDPLREITARLAAGELVIAAVDNYHLPFRPAFHDVHAAHLLVVYGVDHRAGTVLVSDAMPPAFRGAIPVDDFLRAWSSGNPRDVQDAFFSDARIARRCLSVHIDTPPAPIDRTGLRTALRSNRQWFDAPDDPVGWTGLAGLRRYLDDLIGRSRAGDTRPPAELYPLGWGMQAQSYLHGELLCALGAEWDLPELREAGRTVASVAYAWTGLRMTCAHGHPRPAAVVADLRRHAERLRRRYDEAVEAVDRVADLL